MFGSGLPGCRLADTLAGKALSKALNRRQAQPCLMKFHVVLEKQSEGGFVAYIPELPGCHTQGETRGEALKNIREARDLYLEVMAEKKAAKAPVVEILKPQAVLLSSP